ncbi:transcriptional regulator, MarR family [Chitinophaga sp. YR573]|uniref:MarR family winged helix-turn-helix transcriptional regulator n=1 Tax=Chitinophaga sp. YR573 TaxID=1881040 RepID=UPI0008C97C95|nr:MarR family transcriptional regulator [Chitinophaga sp. YR573]SEV88116.1 transcriptional regulator, MarR family [Chitinophaga sp. YR573]
MMKKPDKAFSVKAAEDSSGFLLWQVTTLWQRGIKKALEDINITHPQFVLLASLLWLSKQKDSVTQIDLSQHSKIDPMTTSTVIRTLQQKKMVQRQEHHTDTRAKTITLTETGIKVTRQAIKIIEKFDGAFFSSLASKTANFNSELLLLLTDNGE